MKELTIEEKAKRYDEAIKKVNDYYEGKAKLYSDVDKTLDYLFPELKESEDEKIRKEMLAFFKHFSKNGTWKYIQDVEKWIAWLEKQSQVKDSTISQHEIETCKENNDSLTSEDERIIKTLSNIVKYACDKYGVKYQGKEIGGEKLLSWLKKQGEHANFRSKIQIGDKVTRNDSGVLVNLSQFERVVKKTEKQGKQHPKFRVGDAIKKKSTEDIVTIREVDLENREYRLSNTGFIPFKYEHLWELVEQKPTDKVFLDFKKGDILYEQDTMSILLVYERNGSWLLTFCDYWMPKEKLHIEFPYERYGFVREMSLVPATKEQRDLLFQKLHEAGYIWDAEKKELKTYTSETMNEKNAIDNGFTKMMLKEQKPVEWSEEDEEISAAIIKRITGESNALSISLSSAIGWIRKVKDRVIPQPKEWSEEDEKKRTLLISILEVNHPNGHFKVNPANTLNMEAMSTEELVSWLKSLRPQNWTKEDKERYISCLQRLGTGNPEQPETINSKWFKEHVYPQSTWKPSEEMLEALYRVIPNNVMEKSEDDILLDKLYQGLKYGKVLSEN